MNAILEIIKRSWYIVKKVSRLFEMVHQKIIMLASRPISDIFRQYCKIFFLKFYLTKYFLDNINAQKIRVFTDIVEIAEINIWL